MLFGVIKIADDIEIEDVGGIGSGKKEKKSFKSIVLDQYKACCVEGSKEMTLGGTRKRFIEGEEVIVEVVPNQIEIFCNSVDMLKHLLFPHIQRHSAFIGRKINAFEVNLEKLSNIKKKRIKSIQKNFMRTSVQLSPSDGFSQRQKALPMKKSAIHHCQLIYEKNRYILYKELLGHLSFLMNKMNYFEETGDTI